MVFYLILSATKDLSLFLNFFQPLGTILNMQLHFIFKYYLEENSQI